MHRYNRMTSRFCGRACLVLKQQRRGKGEPALWARQISMPMHSLLSGAVAPLTSSSNQSFSDFRPYSIFLTFADCFFFC